MIKFENVSKLYGSSDRKAVDSISMEIDTGEIFGFIGPNGAGKTTSIKMMVGLAKPSEGKISINGIDPWQDPITSKSKLYYIPDNPHIYSKLKGMEYLNFIGDVYGIPVDERRERIDKYLGIFNIKDSIDDLIGSYSHGMKQKLVLTSGLMVSPDVLILDEPMVGLDPKSAFNLKEIMREFCSEGKTIFFSTHVLEVAENLCSKIGIINKGRLISFGTMEDLRKNENENKSLENIFLELTEE